MKPAKVKLRKFKLHPRYDCERSEGIHPRRARALMAKLRRKP